MNADNEKLVERLYEHYKSYGNARSFNRYELTHDCKLAADLILNVMQMAELNETRIRAATIAAGHKPTVYISGPITGTKDFQERFGKAEQELLPLGFDVENPVAKVGLADDADDIPLSEIMLKDLELLSHCDLIYQLPGWEFSRGSQIEAKFANYLGIRVLTII